MTEESPNRKASVEPGEEPPPVLGTWARLYAVVLVHLGIWILIFYLFTTRFHLPS